MRFSAGSAAGPLLLVISVWAGPCVEAQPSKSERARVEQLVGPLSFDGVPLRTVVKDLLVQQVEIRVAVAICSSDADRPVHALSRDRERLDYVLKALAIQLGIHLRLFVGQHSEVARPTFYCEGVQGTYVTVGDR